MCLRYKHEWNNTMKSASASDDSFNDLRWSLEAVTWLWIWNLKDGQQKAALWVLQSLCISIEGFLFLTLHPIDHALLLLPYKEL